jgi:hypothetical protein
MDYVVSGGNIPVVYHHSYLHQGSFVKLRIKSNHRPAIFRGDKYDRIVAGKIHEVNGEKWPHSYVAVTKGITFEQIEWVDDTPVPTRGEKKEWKVKSSKAGKFYTVRETPGGKRTCSCDGFHYRRQCRHIEEVR